MSMKAWAEREVEIACKRENTDRKEGEWDYGCACYESALKAFNSLLDDGHSGYSIGITKQILNRLIDGKPLTPIEDTDDVWRNCSLGSDGYKTYQCNRMSSLFKDVYDDGRVEYHDTNLCIAVYVNDPDIYWHNGLVSRVAHELFPITMPYIPMDKPYKAYCKELLTDRKNGDFDSIGIIYIMKPYGERVEVNRYFKEGSENNEPWTEIDAEEWIEREWLHNERLRKETMENEENTDTV